MIVGSTTDSLMADIRCIGIATGGGDAPGLNAVIRAATKAAILKHNWKVIGIPDGFDGLIWPEKSFELTLDRVSGILPRGGTILGTTNRGNPFSYKTEENGQEVVRDISDQVIANSKQLGIDAIITIGGDGSQKIGYELFQKGVKIVGVPKTIDNDLSATELTFGFDTALQVATDAIDRLHTTAESHHRILVVEVMGRNAGWIALHSGIAGGADVILIPEIPFDIEEVCRLIGRRHGRGRYFSIVVAAEGAVWTSVGAALGLGLGIAVSAVLVEVVNPQSFHWTMELLLPWLRLAALCAAVIGAGTLTAWLAARAAIGREVALAVKEDW